MSQICAQSSFAAPGEGRLCSLIPGAVQPQGGLCRLGVDSCKRWQIAASAHSWSARMNGGRRAYPAPRSAPGLCERFANYL